MLPPRARGCARELARPGGVFTLLPLPMGIEGRGNREAWCAAGQSMHQEGYAESAEQELAVLLGLACCLLAGVSAAFMHCSAFLDLCKWHAAFE